MFVRVQTAPSTFVVICRAWILFPVIVAHDDTVSIESSHTNASTWGNIILGGGVGYIVDRNSGAAFVYPGQIKIALEKE